MLWVALLCLLSGFIWLFVPSAIGTITSSVPSGIRAIAFCDSGWTSWQTFFGFTDSLTISSEFPMPHTPAFTDICLCDPPATAIFVLGSEPFLSTAPSDMRSQQCPSNYSAITDHVQSIYCHAFSDYRCMTGSMIIGIGTLTTSCPTGLLTLSESNSQHREVRDSRLTGENSITLPSAGTIVGSGEDSLVKVLPSHSVEMLDNRSRRRSLNHTLRLLRYPAVYN
jgi:hypothetical protein